VKSTVMPSGHSRLKWLAHDGVKFITCLKLTWHGVGLKLCQVGSADRLLKKRVNGVGSTADPSVPYV